MKLKSLCPRKLLERSRKAEDGQAKLDWNEVDLNGAHPGKESSHPRLSTAGRRGRPAGALLLHDLEETGRIRICIDGEVDTLRR